MRCAFIHTDNITMTSANAAVISRYLQRSRDQVPCVSMRQKQNIITQQIHIYTHIHGENLLHNLPIGT